MKAKTKQLSIRIPTMMHAKLKIYAATHQKTIRQVILESLPFNQKWKLQAASFTTFG